MPRNSNPPVSRVMSVVPPSLRPVPPGAAASSDHTLGRNLAVAPVRITWCWSRTKGRPSMEFTTASARRVHRGGPAGAGALVAGAAALAALALGIGAPEGDAGATGSHAHAKVTTIHVSSASI